MRLEQAASYCSVSLPVPLDKPFTYQVPDGLQQRVQPGCRVLVTFARRKLTGVVLAIHDRPPEQKALAIERLLDDEPVLDAELLDLATWIATYYCAPLGEVLRGMLPLSGETRRTTTYSLTQAGRRLTNQLTLTGGDDSSTLILSCLREHSRSIQYLAGKEPAARKLVRALAKQGLIVAEEEQLEKDPLRAASESLSVEFSARPGTGVRLGKHERELLAFLELHPGTHNLAALVDQTALRKASEAARSLARKNLVELVLEAKLTSSFASRPRPQLNDSQAAAFAAIDAALSTAHYQPFLLYGVTGSGKTEVYMRSIEAALAIGKNSLLLVPEIALTPAVAGQFFHRFGDEVAILHSAFSDRERAGQWRRIRDGQAKVVVGTRSGVFAPVQNLGLVIVDEEHDGSYKQAETPRYHGRDVAIVRAQKAGAVVVLGSATPTVESRYNADSGKYKMLAMPVRIANRPMPEVELVDMRTEFLETKQQHTFSRRLKEEIGLRLDRREQVMLLLNRRGFSSVMVCRSCGERLQCVNCAVTMTLHKRDARMLCHYCGYAVAIPRECPHCSSEYIQFLGAGSERIEDELFEAFPSARIARLDRDTASGKGNVEHILGSFRDGTIDILVGTQMIAKGHDVANVTLVGIVLADIGLSMPDFRSAERSFQLLTQAAGRAGRGERIGKVIVQTLNPDHYAIQYAARHDYEGFYQKELNFRRWLKYPPFAAFANVLVRAEKKEEALHMASQLGALLQPVPKGIRLMGPAEAPVARLKNEFRYQILVKSSRRSLLRSVLMRINDYAQQQKWKATALAIDVDPLSLM